VRQAFTRLMPWRPEQLFDVVRDVRRYPEFIPYLGAMRVWDEQTPEPGVAAFKAEATIGYSIFRERFGTSVRADRNAGSIEATLLSGPFNRLLNRWKFTPHEQGTMVDFFIDMELRSRMLKAVVDANAGRVTDKIARSFEDRARQLYGATAAA
jgi:coenzyme Q-binding protein COQ10